MMSMRVLLLIILGVLAAIEVIWQQIGHFSVDVRLYGAIMLLFLAFMSGAYFYERVRKDPCVSSLLFGLGFLFASAASLNIIKRSGVVEPFSREKIVAGVRKACQGRPVSDADLAMLAQKVEETIRQTGASQVDANDIGLAILPPLRELDEIAYLRFASVYQGFDSLDDFESAIRTLRDEHERGHGRDADDVAPDER